MKVRIHIVCMALALTTLPHLNTVEAACTHEGQEVCDGAVVSETRLFAKVCTQGKIKLKNKKKLPEPLECKNGDTCAPATGGGRSSFNESHETLNNFRVYVVWRASM